MCLSVTFLVAASPKRLGLATSNFAVHRSYDVEVTLSLFEGQGQIMCILVNASPKLFDIASSNFAGT